jgi:hypothetical protein
VTCSCPNAEHYICARCGLYRQHLPRDLKGKTRSHTEEPITCLWIDDTHRDSQVQRDPGGRKQAWDPESFMAAVGQPLEGHTGFMTSVAYSPNGQHIISGSYHKAIRIWDAETGAAVGQPLRSGEVNLDHSVTASGTSDVKLQDVDELRTLSPRSGVPNEAVITNPGSSGVPTNGSADRASIFILASSFRRKRLQSRAPNAPPESKRSGLRSAGETKDGVTLDDVGKYARQFVKGHPVSVEPSIGDLAMGIISLNSKFGAPGKSLYSAFFSSKPPFTCYECGCVERRHSQAIRHQRQEHFLHFPFACPGGRGHPVW